MCTIVFLCVLDKQMWIELHIVTCKGVSKQLLVATNVIAGTNPFSLTKFRINWKLSGDILSLIICFFIFCLFSFHCSVRICGFCITSISFLTNAKASCNLKSCCYKFWFWFAIWCILNPSHSWLWNIFTWGPFCQVLSTLSHIISQCKMFHVDNNVFLCLYTPCLCRLYYFLCL